MMQNVLIAVPATLERLRSSPIREFRAILFLLVSAICTSIDFPLRLTPYPEAENRFCMEDPFKAVLFRGWFERKRKMGLLP
jgi:hypothetical protein